MDRKSLLTLAAMTNKEAPHHTKEAKEDPAYLHAGELLEFNLANEKALCEERKKKRKRQGQ